MFNAATPDAEARAWATYQATYEAAYSAAIVTGNWASYEAADAAAWVAYGDAVRAAAMAW